jgi:hypothetical protein
MKIKKQCLSVAHLNIWHLRLSKNKGMANKLIGGALDASFIK